MKFGLVAVLVASLTGPVAAQQGQAPAGETALGSVRLTRSVMADGKPLKAGTYQVRVLHENDDLAGATGIVHEETVTVF